MSLDLLVTTQPAQYEDEEEIQLMETDDINWHLEEESQPPVVTVTSVIVEETTKNEEDKPTEEEEENDKPLSLTLIEKHKVYIRDGPDKHHVEIIPYDEKKYELPSADQLTSIGVTEETMKEIWQSLDLTEKDFRTESSQGGLSRPESLYVRGVNNMSTQEILNYFEKFTPIGIEWISDHSCNVFWHDTLSPVRLLASFSISGPCVPHRRPTNYEHAMRLSKQKSSSTSTETINNSTKPDIALPPGHWRMISDDKKTKLYLRYTTLDDRKVRGAETQSEYYRQYGNPNYDNMTGLISRSRKRAINAVRGHRFQDITVVKSNLNSSTSISAVEETTTTATTEDTPDANVKFTVVLPPKKSNEDEHRGKRRRRSRDDDDDKRRKRQTHFTVTIDPTSKRTKDAKVGLKTTPNNNDDDETPVTDARQIIQRKRHNR